MAYLSLADLIAGPVRLSPAEAAALTLAVARRLDEETADGCEPRVPDDHGVLLSSTGTIAFVRGPQAVAADTRTALSALLMRLLRLEDDRPREQVPGGLLIVLARNLGYIQLPPTSPDAFRAALERFATSDPTLLAGIFWRAARVKGAVRRPARAAGASAPTLVDRRRAGVTRAELRRALRDVERELYDTRVRLLNRATPARTRLGVRPELSMGGALRWAGVAGAVVLLASIAAGSGARSVPRDVRLPVLATSAPPIPAAADSAPRVVSVVSESAPDRLPRAARQATPSRASSAARQRQPQRERGPVKRDTTARQFAGGARQIPWAMR